MTTVWKVMGKVDERQLERVFAEWRGQELVAAEGAVSIDGKTLRGSQRYTETALQVVTAAGQEVKMVVALSQVEKGDSVAAALEVLSRLPLEGRVVSMDAGRLQRSVAQTVVKKGGLSRVGERQPL